MTKLRLLFILLVALIACKKTVVVFDPVANENLELPLLLDFNKKSCAFNVEEGILKYSISKSALQGFSPFVEFQSASEVIFENSPLSNGAINELGDLELNKQYALKITSTGKTTVFKLVFTELPIVQIVTQDPIINGPKTLSRIILNYPDKDKPSANNWAGIEHRGYSSLAYDKKSFGIGVLADKTTAAQASQSYFQFKANYKWILDAMFVDQSRLRNKTAFELWNAMAGAANPVGVGAEFVEVFINYKAQGLYCLTENYTDELLGLNQSAVLYKGSDNSTITSFDSISVNKPISKIWGHWEQVFPDPSKTIRWTHFEALSSLIVKASDSEFKAQIADLIDLDNVIDYFIFINVCGGIDNMGKNWFFLKRNQSAKFTIIPWDMDGTWGRDPFGEVVNYKRIVTNRFFNRLKDTNPENYQPRLKARWNTLRLSALSNTNLVMLFQSYFNTLNKHQIIAAENKLWGLSLNLATEETYISDWITNRMAFLDTYFE